MELTISRYTYQFKNEESFFLYNSESNTFLKIDQDLYLSLERKDLTQIAEEVIVFFQEKRILIPEEEKDVYYYKKKLDFNLNTYSLETIGLVLVPNMGCNFDCPYCFETHKISNEMDSQTVSDLMKFISEHKHSKNIDLTWCGGEPLLSFNKIKDILGQIANLNTHKITQHNLITNGYLLNKEVVSFFQEHPLTSIQVTLDGREEVHNQKRKLAEGGQPTYKKILENIDYALLKLSDTRINIRININKENKDDFISEQKKLLTKWAGKNIYIYPGFLREENTAGTKLNSQCFVGQEQELFNIEMKERGAVVNLFPMNAPKGCMANRLRSYIVGASGEIYKCWNDVSDPLKIVGNIKDSKIYNISLLSQYMDASCFNDDKCMKCFHFPICSGGCTWYRMKNLYENGKFNICSAQKGNKLFEKSLITHYQSKK